MRVFALPAVLSLACFGQAPKAPLPEASTAEAAGELRTTLKDQQALAVTIYNDGRALVKDQRLVHLPAGEGRLAFQEVSAQIRPETALLRNLTEPKGFSVVEQNFDFDLLTPQKLLEKAVGQKVAVISTRPKGQGMEEIREEALVLATNQGPVLQFADRIETDVPGRIAFSQVPAGLRARPTLVITLDSPAEKAQKLELSYLTGGLNWKADYVANLSADEKTLDLSGWVTLTNQSGAAYPNALLQLVAGDVNKVELDAETPDDDVSIEEKKPMEAPPAPAVREEALFEYHLYTLDRPTTLQENQTKQVALLGATSVPILKELRLQGQDHYYSGSYGELGEKLKVGVFVSFDNKEAANLGKPMPKGVVRVYKRDSAGRAQFVGEDAIDHTPKNEKITLKLGDAFDVTAHRKQTDFKKIGGSGRYNYIYESAFEVELKNAKKEPVVVQVLEPMPGDWQIMESSHTHTKEASGTARFSVPVPAEGKAKLTYRVRVRW